MLDRIKQFIKSAGAPTEQDSDRNGFLSYAAEAHSVGHGLYHGLTSRRPFPSEIPENSDVQKEPHYFKGAYVLGTLLQALLVLLGVYAGVGVM